MLGRFEKLDLPDLNFSEKYVRILAHYSRDIEAVSRIYQKSKDEPPIARDLPPMAGRIVWCRQLYRRINHPMRVFEANGTILQYGEAKKIIRNYNKVAAVLIEYELLYYRTWLRQVEIVMTGVHASLLIKTPETSEYAINFDPEIITLIRETECMKRLKLEIPNDAANLVLRQDLFKSHYDRLKFLMDEYKRIKTSIPAIFSTLVAPKLQSLDQVISPGCISLTWVSPNIDEFCDSLEKAVGEFDLLVVRIKELITYRIEAVLHDVINTPLVEINDEDAVFVDEFLARAEELCQKGADSIRIKSKNVEEATEELIELIYPEYNTEFGDTEDDKSQRTMNEARALDSAKTRALSGSIRPAQLTQAQINLKRKREAWLAMQEAAYEVFNYFNHKNVESLLKLIKATLEKLRKRIAHAISNVNYKTNAGVGVAGAVASSSSMASDTDQLNRKKETPMFKAYAVLAIPNVAMQPSLDEIQLGLNKTIQLVLLTTKQVLQWKDAKKRILIRNRREANKSDNKEDNQSLDDDIQEVDDESADQMFSSNTALQKNYYKTVSENKEIAKMVSALQTYIASTKKDIVSALESFKSYQFIWQKDRDEDLKEFLATDPRVGEFEVKIKSFSQLIAEINSYPDLIPVSVIALITEKLKLGLTSEIQLWKNCYGQACNQKYKREINEVLVFVEDVTKRLQREIKDLDDIRLAMQALKEVRENEIRIDMTIQPIEECYALLQRHEIPVSREEIERCDTLRYNWQKLLQMTSQMSGHLLQLQPLYKDNLKNNVRDFQIDCNRFYENYKTNGPMVAGVPPREASDRLFLFQNNFDALYRKYVTYTGGEELFGLPVTPYPELLEIR